MWLICKATLGRGKNKLLVRGSNGAEWVFCPRIKSIKRDMIGIDRCNSCKHFISFQQTRIPRARITRNTLSYGTNTLHTTFRIARPSSRKKATDPHIKPTSYEPGLIKEREPLIDLFEEEDHLIALAELPSANENDVNIKTEENTITISVDTATKKYRKKIRLPTPINKDTVKSTYRNNILQIKLEKLR